MCKGKNEGGQRCAAHTRPDAQAALNRMHADGASTLTDAELDDLAAHASTPSGRAELEAELIAITRRMQTPQLPDDELRELVNREAALTQALHKGDQMRAATADTRAALIDRDDTVRDLIDTTPAAGRSLDEVIEAGNAAFAEFIANGADPTTPTTEQMHDMIQFASTTHGRGFISGLMSLARMKKDPVASFYEGLRGSGNLYRQANPDATKARDTEWLQRMNAEQELIEQTIAAEKEHAAAVKAAAAAGPQPDPITHLVNLDELTAMPLDDVNTIARDIRTPQGQFLSQFIPYKGRIVKLSRKKLNGIDAVNVTSEDEYEQRVSEYFTEDGFTVSPLAGQFSDGYSWEVGGGNIAAKWNDYAPDSSGMSGGKNSVGVRNLDEAGAIIRRFRQYGAPN